MAKRTRNKTVVIAHTPRPNRTAPAAIRLGDEPSPFGQPILIKKNGAIHANDALNSACCRWPIGDPGSPGFHFCGRTVVPLKSWCPGHALRASQGATVAAARAEDVKVKETATA